MKSKLFISTAAAALLAGMTFAVAQSGGGAGSGGAGGSGGAASGQSGGGSGGGGAGGMGAGGSGGMGGGASGGAERAPSAQPSRQGTQSGQTDKGDRNAQGDRGKGGERNAQGNRQENTGAGPSGSISTQQRSQIRERIGSRGRVTNVNFNVGIGVAVPASVTLVGLPPAIVEIVPQYRGYDYIIVRDDILIIEPRTRKIVFVIEG